LSDAYIEHPDERPLELAHARPDVRRDELEHGVGDRRVEVVELRLLAQDGDPVLELREVDVRHHPPLEAAHEPRLEPGDLLRRPVGGEADLPPRLVDGVEGVEELLLRALLPLQELHVVDEQQVGLAVAPPELLRRPPLQRGDELVRELLGPHVGDARARVALEQHVGDGLHEVRLAEPRVAVDEQRVVDLPRRLRRPLRGRRRHVVRLADDEVVERVARVERRLRPRVGPRGRRERRPGRAGRRRRGARRLGRRLDEEVELRALAQLLVDLERHVHRVAERHRGVARQQRRVLRLVPLGAEPVRRADHDAPPLEGERRGGLEPRAEGLFGKLLAGAGEEPVPHFGGRERHYGGLRRTGRDAGREGCGGPHAKSI
jgi:hypothetical protein